MRPWLQDFTATWVKGHIKYGPEQIRAQIQAVYDAGYEEWILWNAANRYTEGGLYGADGKPRTVKDTAVQAEAASPAEEVPAGTQEAAPPAEEAPAGTPETVQSAEGMLPEEPEAEAEPIEEAPDAAQGGA